MLARQCFEVGFRSYLGEWAHLWSGDRAGSLRAFWQSDLPRQLSAVHAVIVNGEGTIHHGGGLHLLAILAGAQEMRLPTFLVNAVFQECEQDLQTLRQLDDFTVRDAASSACLKRLGVPHRIVLDSIFEAPFEAAPAHDFRGKIVVTDWHLARAGDVGAASEKLLNELGAGAVFYPLDSPEREHDWRQALADFQQARLVVTGRHHGLCLAALAGVPFVALGSNTWKIEGMLELLPGGLRVSADPTELPCRSRGAGGFRPRPGIRPRPTPACDFRGAFPLAAAIRPFSSDIRQRSPDHFANPAVHPAARRRDGPGRLAAAGAGRFPVAHHAGRAA
jgi:hypothetical protein